MLSRSSTQPRSWQDRELLATQLADTKREKDAAEERHGVEVAGSLGPLSLRVGCLDVPFGAMDTHASPRARHRGGCTTEISTLEG